MHSIFRLLAPKASDAETGGRRKRNVINEYVRAGLSHAHDYRATVEFYRISFPLKASDYVLDNLFRFIIMLACGTRGTLNVLFL